MKKINHLESGFISVPGADMYIEMTGKGHTVVFVHGLGLDNRIWDEQFPVFAEKYQVIRYDLRGFGKSSLPGSQAYSHHQDLAAMLRHLQIEKISLVGLSMGGRIALDFTLTFPEMVSSLVLVDSALHGYTFQTFSLDKIITVAGASGIDPANQAWLEHELFDSANRIPRVSAALKRIVADYSGWHWLNRNPWTPLAPPSIEQLNSINTPTLILAGEFDLPDFQEIAKIISEKIPGSKKITIPHAGHMSNMENPEYFNEVVCEFLTGQMGIKN